VLPAHYRPSHYSDGPDRRFDQPKPSSEQHDTSPIRRGRSITTAGARARAFVMALSSTSPSARGDLWCQRTAII